MDTGWDRATLTRCACQVAARTCGADGGTGGTKTNVEFAALTCFYGWGLGST